MNKHTVFLAECGMQVVQADRHSLSDHGLTLFVGDAVVARFPEYQALLIELPPSSPAQSVPTSVYGCDDPRVVELAPGEALLMEGTTLTDAIEAAARILSDYGDSRATPDLHEHLRALLVTQRSRFLPSAVSAVEPGPVAQSVLESSLNDAIESLNRTLREAMPFYADLRLSDLRASLMGFRNSLHRIPLAQHIGTV